MRVAVGQEKPKSSIQSKLTATFENPNQPKSVSSTANGRVGFRSVSAPLALRYLKRKHGIHTWSASHGQ